MGLSLKTNQKLQLVQNTALQMNASHYAHVTMLLCELQRLPTRFWVWFNMLVFSFKALYDIGMGYLWDCLLPRTCGCPTFQVPSFTVENLLFLFCCSFIPASPRDTLLEMSGFIQLITSYKLSKHLEKPNYIFLVHFLEIINTRAYYIMRGQHLLACIRYSLFRGSIWSFWMESRNSSRHTPCIQQNEMRTSW